MDIAFRRLLPTFWFQKSIAVFGSAHVDILGKSRDHADRLDKIGDVELRLGGSAYNIAMNLARELEKVRIWTVLKRGSLVEKWVLSKLRRQGIITSELTRKRKAAAGAFLATVHNNDYISAITFVGVDQVDLPRRKVRRLIRKSEIVVADCNLSVDQLCCVIEEANALGKPLVISGVSESKVLRFREAMRLADGGHVFAVTADSRIFSQLEKFVKAEPDYAGQSITQTIHAEVIAVFEGVNPTEDGASHTASCRFIFPDGREERVTDLLSGQVTKTGGRDATAAGMAIVLSRAKTGITADNVPQLFRRHAWPLVCRILRAGGPTIGELEHEASIANFGIETAPVARHVLIWQAVRRSLTLFAQGLTGLLAIATGLAQLFPERIGPILDWVGRLLFGI